MLINLVEGLLTKCEKLAYNRFPPKAQGQKLQLTTKVIYLVTSQDQEKPMRYSSVPIHIHHGIFVEGGIPILST